MNKRDYEILSEDYIKSLSENDLRRLFLDVRSKINRGRRKKQNTRQAEIDFCYIQQEVNLRNEYKNMARRKKQKK